MQTNKKIISTEKVKILVQWYIIHIIQTLGLGTNDYERVQKGTRCIRKAVIEMTLQDDIVNKTILKGERQ